MMQDAMEVRLPERRTWATAGRAAGLQVEVLEGAAWLTQEGDAHDYVLFPGSQFSSRSGGRILVQALLPAPSGKPSGGARIRVVRGDTLWQRIGRLVTRARDLGLKGDCI